MFIKYKDDRIIIDLKDYNHNIQPNMNIVLSDEYTALIDIGNEVIEVKNILKYKKLIIKNVNRGNHLMSLINHWDIVIQNSYFSNIRFDCDHYFKNKIPLCRYYIHNCNISLVSIGRHTHSLHISDSDIYMMNSLYQIGLLKATNVQFNSVDMKYIGTLIHHQMSCSKQKFNGFISVGKIKNTFINFNDTIIAYFLGLGL